VAASLHPGGMVRWHYTARRKEVSTKRDPPATPATTPRSGSPGPLTALRILRKPPTGPWESWTSPPSRSAMSPAPPRPTGSKPGLRLYAGSGGRSSWKPGPSSGPGSGRAKRKTRGRRACALRGGGAAETATPPPPLLTAHFSRRRPGVLVLAASHQPVPEPRQGQSALGPGQVSLGGQVRRVLSDHDVVVDDQGHAPQGRA